MHQKSFIVSKLKIGKINITLMRCREKCLNTDKSEMSVLSESVDVVICLRFGSVAVVLDF